MSESKLIRRIRNNILRNNGNFLGLIVGPTGSGKSLSALTLCKEIDEKFSIEHVVFTPRDFLHLLNSGTLYKGAAILLDEAGAGALASRQWYTEVNKQLMYVLETFRRENYALIMTTPSIDFLDSQSRRLLHVCLETQQIDRKRNLCGVKWLEMEWSGRYQEMYYKYPRIRIKGQASIQLRRVWIPRPPQDLIDAYDIKQKEFKDNIRIHAEEVVSNIGIEPNAADDRAAALEKLINDIKAAPQLYYKNKSNKIIVDLYMIMAKLGTTRDLAQQAKTLVEHEINA